jgi:hypothetical protein
VVVTVLAAAVLLVVPLEGVLSGESPPARIAAIYLQHSASVSAALFSAHQMIFAVQELLEVIRYRCSRSL